MRAESVERPRGASNARVSSFPSNPSVPSSPSVPSNPSILSALASFEGA